MPSGDKVTQIYSKKNTFKLEIYKQIYFKIIETEQPVALRKMHTFII